MALMCISVEVGANDRYGNPQWWCPWNAADPDSKNYPHDSQSNDGRSVGYFQQQKGPNGELWWGTSGDEMTLKIAANNFLDRLADDYKICSGNATLAGEYIANVQRCAPGYRHRYATKWAEGWDVLGRALKQENIEAVQQPNREKVLNYNRAIVPQETGWWCGPAATQIALDILGIKMQERDIAAEIEQIENPGRGDDRDGTDYIGLIETFLDRKVPWAKYTSVYVQNDPMNQSQKDRFWNHIVRSIDAGYGVIVNIVAPPSNPPRATKGSVAPPYPKRSTTFHYAIITGYDPSGSRAVWIADSAAFGGITGFWNPFDGPGSICSLVPPKGYCYADLVPAPKPEPAPAKPQPQPQPKPAEKPSEESVDMSGVDVDKLNRAVEKILQQYGSRSMFRDSNSNVDDAFGMMLNSDASIYDVLVLIRAFIGGEPQAIARIRRLANGKGPAGSEKRNVDVAKALWANLSEEDKKAAESIKVPGE